MMSAMIEDAAAPAGAAPAAVSHAAGADVLHGSRQFITFRVDGREYGVDIRCISEVKGWTETDSLPGMPYDTRGVLNLRGVVVPIYDIRARFGGGATEVDKTNVIIIVTIGERQVGMLADGVSDIITLSGGEVMPVPDVGDPLPQQVMAGLVTIEGRMVALLDLRQMFGEAGLA
jgi:purine-binding chemotaxis protein CheW